MDYSMEVNAIYEGDNLDVLSKFENESVNLIYADPPFYTSQEWEVIWKDTQEKMAFKDRWAGGIEHYITYMKPRLTECHRVLKKTGSMYLHCDWHANYKLRELMNSIFTESQFRNEIIWYYYNKYSAGKKCFPRAHDTILFYSKTDDAYFNPLREKREEPVKQLLRENIDGVLKNKKDKKGHCMYRIVEDKKMDDVWRIPCLQPASSDWLGYPTQKHIDLLKRIVEASSKEGDIVLDPFCGCGTTLAAAQVLGRKWIGIDVSPTACKLMVKRMRQKYSVNANWIRGAVDINYIKKLPHFEFQNWVVVNKFGGRVSATKSGDMGIDGFTPQIYGGYPIQVKQSEGIGRNPIDNFRAAIQRYKMKKGYFVAYSFGSGAVEEVARLKNQEGIEIILRTVQELLDGKVE